MDKLAEIKELLAKAAHKDNIEESMKLRELGIDSLDRNKDIAYRRK